MSVLSFMFYKPHLFHSVVHDGTVNEKVFTVYSPVIHFACIFVCTSNRAVSAYSAEIVRTKYEKWEAKKVKNGHVVMWETKGVRS